MAGPAVLGAYGSKRERGGGRGSPCGTHGGPRRLSSSRDGAGDEEGRRRPETWTKGIRRFGAPQLQLRPPVDGEDDGRAHRQGQRARGRRWPRQRWRAAATVLGPRIWRRGGAERARGREKRERKGTSGQVGGEGAEASGRPYPLPSTARWSGGDARARALGRLNRGRGRATAQGGVGRPVGPAGSGGPKPE